MASYSRAVRLGSGLEDKRVQTTGARDLAGTGHREPRRPRTWSPVFVQLGPSARPPSTRPRLRAVGAPVTDLATSGHEPGAGPRIRTYSPPKLGTTAREREEKNLLLELAGIVRSRILSAPAAPFLGWLVARAGVGPGGAARLARELADE